MVIIVVIYFTIIKESGSGGSGGSGGGDGNSNKRGIELESLGFIGHPINSRIVGRNTDAINNMARLLHERIHMPQRLN